VGAYGESRAHLGGAFRLDMQIRAQKVALDVLLGIATLFEKEGKRERALELLAFVVSDARGGQEIKDCAESFFTETATGLPPDEVALLHERARKQTLSEVATSVLAELT